MHGPAHEVTCRECGCRLEDHNRDGYCTSCGDCDGWRT